MTFSLGLFAPSPAYILMFRRHTQIKLADSDDALMQPTRLVASLFGREIKPAVDQPPLAVPPLFSKLPSHLTYKFLSEELYEYLDAAIMVQTSPEEAYRKVTMAKRIPHTKLSNSIASSLVLRQAMGLR